MSRKSVCNASDESSPPSVQERGSLRTLGEGRSQFIGSSSGVYFVNTVWRAFAAAGNRPPWLPQNDDDDNDNPSPEDCIVVNEDNGGSQPEPTSGTASPRQRAAGCYGTGRVADLGQPPPQHVARELFMAYFKTWHPLFPFLHGPTVAKDMERLYSSPDEGPSPSRYKKELPLASVIILQCLFNLASLHHQGGLELPAASRIDRPAKILSHLLVLTTNGDIVSIQALFAMQLLLVARMSLRLAAVVAGLLSRAIFLVGLHRCPVRYSHLSAEDCDMRKRLFWCIYVLDRFLSQALGHPLGIQDSDIDVCSMAGPELHLCHTTSSSPPPSAPRDPVYERSMAEADQTSIQQVYPGGWDRRRDRQPDISVTESRHKILSCQVEYSRLLGRALELYHKSIHIRSVEPSTVVSLRTDLNAWWNSLPSELQDADPINPHGDDAPSRQTRFTPPGFFHLLHCQLKLLINRPWLSLEPSAPEFQLALQICIGVSRDIIQGLRRQRGAGYALFWPGYLSAAWMAGIILAFASHLGLYPAQKGQEEIALCLDVLAGMSSHWPLAQNCHLVLSDLQHIIQQDGCKLQQTPPLTTSGSPLPPSQKFAREPCRGQTPAAKRRRMEPEPDSQASHFAEANTTSSLSGSNLQSSDARLQADQTNAPRPGVDMSLSDWGWGSGTTTANVQTGRLACTPGNRASQSQAPSQPTWNDMYTSTVPDLSPIPTAGGDNSAWTSVPGASSWNGGMPDLLGSATWESLFQVFNHDKHYWDGEHG